MQIEPNENQSEDQIDARRDALKKIAIFGAYTAPVMVSMLSATKAVAASTGGGGGCCFVDAFLASGRRVGDAVVGDPLRKMLDDGSGAYEGVVSHIRRPEPQPCRTFTTGSAIALTLSHSTPVPVRRGGTIDYLRAVDVIDGDVLPVEDADGFRWEPLARIEERGMLPVHLLTANDGVYAAGDQAGRFIYTHNASTSAQPVGKE